VNISASPYSGPLLRCRAMFTAMHAINKQQRTCGA
jgi:hypothetical protein